MPQVGYASCLYVNTGTTETPTWTEIDMARDVTLNYEKDEINSNARATARLGWKSTIDGLKSMAAEFESLKPAPGETANAGFTALRKAYRKNLQIEVISCDAPINTTTPADAVYGVFGVFGGSEGQPLEDVVAISYTLKNAGVPQFGTVSEGTFTADAE